MAPADICPLIIAYAERQLSPGGIGTTATSSATLHEFHLDDKERTEIEGLDWTLAPVSAKIGFPLKVVACERRNPKAAPGPNIAFNPLFVQLNPESQNFGRSTLGHREGDIMMLRCDGGETQTHHVEAVISFLNEKLQEIMALISVDMGRQEEVKAKKRIADSINADPFREHFEKLRQNRLERGDETFKDVSIPPHSKGRKYCGRCGAFEKEEKEEKGGKTENAKLLGCSRFQTVYYCNKECQKKDWPLHKQACKTKAK